MNESAPATLRVPARWWERLAAGLLASVWVGVAVYYRLFSDGWWRRALDGFVEMHRAWRFFLGNFTGGLSVLIDSALILHGLYRGLDVMLFVSVPAVIVWAGWRALQREPRRGAVGLWWLALGHGALGVLHLSVWSRAVEVGRSLTSQPPGMSPAWYEGWLGWIASGFVTIHGVFFLVCFGEILLAALVLGGRWWKRRRAKAGNALAAGGAEGAGARA